MKFEIYERATGKVVETVEADARDFVAYWAAQGNKEEYGHRPVPEKKSGAKPPRTRNPTKTPKKKC